MATRFWKIALGVGCGVVLVAIVAVIAGIWGMSELMQQASQRQFEPLEAIEVRECESSRDGDSVKVKGSVLNGGEGRVGLVKVALQWQDPSGAVIEQEWAYAGEADGLAPGGSSVFEHVWEDPAGKLDRVSCRVACVSTEQATLCY